MESLITDTSTSAHPVIGVFPSNWGSSRFGREFEPSSERNGDSPIGPMLSVSEYRGVEVRTNFRDGQLPSEDVSHYRVVRPGQLVANLMWLDHGGLGVSHFPGYVSPAYLAFNISERVDPAFAHHVLRSSVYVDSYKRLGRGVRPNSQMVDSVDLRQLPFPLPPLETQRRIADYLDRETAEIDAAVADLGKYVTLLKKRLELSVTKMLEKDQHPSVPLFTMCDFSSGEGVTRDELHESGGYPVYGGNGIMGYSKQYNQSVDSIVVGRVGALCGNVHLAKAPFFVTDNALVVTLKEEVSLDWLVFALRDLRLRELSQSSAQPVITSTKVSRQRVSRPSFSMQSQIADSILKETSEVNALMAESTKLRDLLLKRRSVLITDVVTGRKQV